MKKILNVNKLKTYISCLMIFAILSVLLVSALPVRGKTSISDLEEQMADNEKAIKDAQQEISTKNAELSKSQTEILEAEVEIERYNQIVFGLGNDIVNKEGEIDLTLARIAETIREQEEYYEHAKERIKVMYEHGSTEYIEVLLESSSTSDFFNLLEYLNKLVEYDQSILEQIERTRFEIEAYENQLVNEKKELVALQKENTKNLNTVEEYRSVKENEIVKIQEDKDLIAEQIMKMEKEQEEIDAMIQELIRLYSDQDLLFGDGKLDWPVPGWSRISSYFGPRRHPVYGYKSTHTGIDIPASYGTAIKASASGQVIFAGWGNAYGNYLLIDHGKDTKGRHIITQYAHCSSMLVVEGDVVLRGDTIAKIGSTGWSTGNHLHFGVQVGGKWINPLNKLDR